MGKENVKIVEERAKGDNKL